MISEILQFIKERFDSMPRWLQISTFVVFVASFLGLLFSPKYIDIRLVGVNNNNQEFPIAEARVVVETESRVITIVTDSEGRFSIPIGLANPFVDYTIVLYPILPLKKGEEIITVDVNVGGHMAFFSGWSKLKYSKNDGKYTFAASVDMGLIKSAYAQDSAGDFRTKDNIDDVVIEAISKVKGIDSSKIGLEQNLSEDLVLSNYDLSYVTHVLKEKYDIESWQKVWDNAETVEDIIAIARALYYGDKPWGEHLIPRNVNIDKLLNEARENYPKKAYKDLEAARVLRKSGKNTKAVNLLNSILLEHPDYYLVKYNQALAYDAMSNIESAANAYQSAITMQEEQGFSDSSIYNTYGRFLYRNGRYKESLQAYKKVKEIDPSRAFSDEYIKDSLDQLECKTISECITKP